MEPTHHPKREAKPNPVDEAGRESFPASDPPAVHLEGPVSHGRMSRLRPMLAVADLQRTMLFYRERLGFTRAGTFGNPPVWAEMARDDIAIMFNAPPPDDVRRDVPARSRDDAIYYIDVPDVEALHKELLDRGAEPTDLRVTVYGMKEFEVRDPDGIRLWFGQPTEEPPAATE